MRWILPLLLLSACSDHPPDAGHATYVPQVHGSFQSKTYPVGDDEHVVVFDVPNRVFPNRCLVYVNEKLGTTNMRCDDADTGPLPEQGPPLEK